MVLQTHFNNVGTIRETLKRAKAENLGITESALRRWVKEDRFHVVYIGKRALIDWPVLIKFLTGSTDFGTISNQNTETRYSIS